ncbi:MAG: uroporphyrinogen decarboxylase family protein [Planctomycetota bacterium]
MNHRQRFVATMRYQARDRAPIADFSFWDETLEAWYEQGLPRSVDRATSDDYFGMDPLFRCVLDAESTALVVPSDPSRSVFEGVFVGLVPEFDFIVLEDRGDSQVIQQPDGVRVLKKKSMSSIPLHQGHLLLDRESWKKHYLPRLDPGDPRRYPKNWDRCARLWRDDARELPIFLSAGSFYGWIRNWMGLEAVSTLVYDDPAWFEEMVTTVADCVLGVLERVLATGGKFEGCGLWEDMCYNSGPLLGPAHFKRYLVPHYRRLTDLLGRHGVDVVWVDCDGKIDQLVPLWRDAGVNCMFPVEVGTWGGDPIKLRNEYGKDLLMMGGFDKRILARGKDAIEAEVRRLAPLVEEGGYIGFCDHRVPPDVPLENHLHYLALVRRLWGHNQNLRPMRVPPTDKVS